VAALVAGGTTAPIRTEAGYHMLHADSVRTVAGAMELKLREILLVPKISPETLDSLRTRVTEAAGAAQKDFEATARQLGVAVQRVESVEKLGFISGIGYAKRLVDWAFAAEPGHVSIPVGTDDAILFAKLVAKNPEGPRPFEEVSAHVPAAVKENQRKAIARQRLERVLERVRGGTTLDAAARAEGLQVKEPAPFTFIDNVPDVGSRNEFSAVALALEPGKTSDVVETSTGAYVIQVVSREPFDETAYLERRQALYQNLLGRRQTEVYQAWIEELRERATIDDRRSPRV
jgi:parvulin-like peptidyl-prolyl isomerase